MQHERQRFLIARLLPKARALPMRAVENSARQSVVGVILGEGGDPRACRSAAPSRAAIARDGVVERAKLGAKDLQFRRDEFRATPLPPRSQPSPPSPRLRSFPAAVPGRYRNVPSP